MVVGQLPWKTSEGGGGGVPLSATECDSFCLKHLTASVINLTDGAAPYEAFAAGDVACSPNCNRKDCLKRALARGKAKCNGWRPRCGRARFQEKYKHLRLAHGVVSHNKEEWSLVKKIAVTDSRGHKRTVKLKHGTEVADGTWSEIKRCYPREVKSKDHERIAEYINAWAWRARRHGEDLFVELGRAVRTRM